jgi:hypothetical protein
MSPEERKKEEREKNAIYSGHLRLCQQPRAAHTLRSDQKQGTSPEEGGLQARTTAGARVAVESELTLARVLICPNCTSLINRQYLRIK